MGRQLVQAFLDTLIPFGGFHTLFNGGHMTMKPNIQPPILAIIRQTFVQGYGGSTSHMPNLVIALVDQNPHKPGFE